ncbi:DUF2780 domain-containing protein [Paraglaciecola sp. L1A13]|uniref:DUF2780 domain-containing protein n=1 Tax=Paraglaciecola sp. L1A13 TaxID=2686359 RepID=UPI00131D8A06|nr:DUF2780 domain-containing protein [Paraglaciecola sp. L1A13]
MKKLSVVLTVAALSIQPQAHAEGWLDSIKNMLGMETQQEAATPSITGMVSSVTDSLGVTQSQASGGLGAIFNYAKDNISSEQYSQLADALPGVGGLLESVPDISSMTSEGGLGGILDKASSYNDSLKALNDVKKQFEALGLKPEMITQFVSKAQAYLDTPEGQQAKQLLTQGLGKLLTSS